MITSADIENKEFSKSKRGYDEEEVDEFLDLIILDMEKLIFENKRLSTELERANSKVEKDESDGNSVYETLEAAKQLMNDIAASAERRADIILKNAELEADSITREAKENVSRYIYEGNRLKAKVESMKERYRKMLSSELDSINGFSDDFIVEFEKDFLTNDANGLSKNSMNADVKVEKLESASQESTAAADNLQKTVVMPKLK